MGMGENKRIKGIMAAVLTPFNEKEKVNYRVLEKEIEFTIRECEADAVIAA